MISYNDSINHRVMTRFSSLENELSFNPDKNYLFDLSYLSMLQVQGEHAKNFLQGQLSCDIREVNSHQYQHGALCNLKGRVLALVDALYQDETTYQLILPDDLISKTTSSLEKTAMLSRVALVSNQPYQVMGLYLQNPNDILPESFNPLLNTYEMSSNKLYSIYYLGQQLYVLIVPSHVVAQLKHPYFSVQQWRGSLAWHRLKLQHQWIEIYPNTRGLFLPHRLNLQHLGYLNFNKGCYKGQEIIARMHYRATLKHELQCFIIETDGNLCSGQRLFGKDSTIEIGELVDYCPIGDKHYFIAASLLLEHPNHVYIEDHPHAIELKIPVNV